MWMQVMRFCKIHKGGRKLSGCKSLVSALSEIEFCNTSSKEIKWWGGVRGNLPACIKTVSMQPSKCCFSLPGKLAEASTHWAQCERAEQPPPARKGECCWQTYAGKGILSGQQHLCVDGHVWEAYRCCLLSYCDTSWSTGLSKKHHSGSAQKEGHAEKDIHCLCFYTEQPFGFSLQQSSDIPSVVYFDGAPAFLLIYSCQKAATLAGIAFSLKSLFI